MPIYFLFILFVSFLSIISFVAWMTGIKWKGLCVLASYMIKKYKCYYIPESAATLLVNRHPLPI